MRILALETSGMAGSVAALENAEPLFEFQLDPARRTAQTLAPAMDATLKQVGWRPRDVELVAVTKGPGSFTGLRIGITTAKTFAYATGAPIVGVNTLSVIASQSTAGDGLLWVIMNAERDQLFAAGYQRVDDSWREIEPVRIVDNQTWLQGLARDARVVGTGLKGLLDQIPSGVQVLDEKLWAPQAIAVGRTGLKRFIDGHKSDWWSLLPDYFRESAAMEKARTPSK